MHTLGVFDRRTFLDWIADGETPSGQWIDSIDELRERILSGSIGLLQPSDESSPFRVSQPVVVIPDDELVDFLAWTSTYISNYSPFTAFFRVLTIGDLDRFELLEPRHRVVSDELLTQLCGIAIAEAVVQLPQPPRALTTVSIQACQATFSYACLRGLAAGMHPADLSELAEKWSRARQLTSDSKLRLSVEGSSLFWMILTSNLMNDFPERSIDGDAWTQALGELIHSARNGTLPVASAAWSQLRHTLPDEDISETLFELPREEQLAFLDRTTRDLVRSKTPVPLAEAWVGLLASRLANGSFDYIGVLNGVRDELPASLLWFALFSIWRPGFDGLVSGRCLGRHVAKEALQRTSLFDPPAADISLNEFEVTARNRLIDSTRTKISSAIEIEVLPTISCKFRISRTRDDDGRSSGPDLDVARIRRSLIEALRLLDGPPDRVIDTTPPRQRSLFEKASNPPKQQRGKKAR